MARTSQLRKLGTAERIAEAERIAVIRKRIAEVVSAEGVAEAWSP